jgi:hypothetical protein
MRVTGWAMAMVCATAVATMFFMAACAEKNAEGPGAHTMAEEPPPRTSEEMTVSSERHDAIERTFARKAGELQSCWSDAYDKTHDRKLEGDVTLGMNITPSGVPADVRVLTTTIKSPAIESCVVRAVSGWQFPDGQAKVPYMRTVHLGAQF